MPITRIKDIDNTSIQDVESINNTVYVPGFIKDFDETGYEACIEVNQPVLFDSLSEFAEITDKLKHVDGTELKDNDKLLIKIIYGYLQHGLTVLYECFQGVTVLSLELVKKLSDRAKYDIRILTAGVDFINQTSFESLKAVAEGHESTTAEPTEIIGRGDCYLVIDHEHKLYDDTGAEIEDSLKYAEAAHKQIIEFLDYQPESGQLEASGDTSYGASFSPWCEVEIDEERVIVPGGVCGILAYAYSLQNGNNYGLAGAGISRGIIPGLVAPEFDYGTAECEVLGCRKPTLDEEGDNVGIAINPICNVRPYGVVVWGDRTLIYNEGVLKASSFLNIRNMVSQVNKKLFDLSRKYAFEQNTDILWYNFKADLEPTLDEEVECGVIAGYKVQKVLTGIKGRLTAKVKIVAIDPVEDFDIVISLEDSIVSTEIEE